MSLLEPLWYYYSSSQRLSIRYSFNVVIFSRFFLWLRVATRNAAKARMQQQNLGKKMEHSASTRSAPKAVAGYNKNYVEKNSKLCLQNILTFNGALNMPACRISTMLISQTVFHICLFFLEWKMFLQSHTFISGWTSRLFVSKLARARWLQPRPCSFDSKRVCDARRIFLSSPK